MEKQPPVPDPPIDLNDVTREQLEVRCGLAPEVSDAIVTFRAEHGPWTSIEQLLEIPEIDASMLDALRQCVYVVPPGKAVLPATDEGVPVPDEPLVEQAERFQSEPEQATAAPILGPTTSGGPEADSSEDFGVTLEAADAFSADMLDLEPALEAGVPDYEWIEESPLVPEPLSDLAINEPAREPDYGELDSTGAATEAIATDHTSVGDLDQDPGASDESVDGEQISSLAGAHIVPEMPSEGVTSRQEIPVTPLPCEPGEPECESARAEELPEAVVADAAEVRAPEHVEEQQKVSLLPTESVAATTAAVAVAPAPVRRRSVWHDIGLIALGGLVGALLTLLILGGVGGTLSYAPRRLVDALSQNMSIMQDNQETTWSQLQSLSSRADALETRLGALETLEGRVVELERGSAAMDAQLGELSGGVDQLSANLAALESRHAALIQGLDTRMGSQERDLDALGETVGALSDSVETMQEAVDKFESFFDALRDLLIDMQGDAAAESGA